MAEQIMWAVKGPGDEPVLSVGHSASEAWNIAEVVHGYDRPILRMDGYRCVRVRVTEVQDGP